MVVYIRNIGVISAIVNAFIQIRDKKLFVRILRLCHRNNSFRNEDWHKNCADKIKRELMHEINRYINSLFKVFYLCIELR